MTGQERCELLIEQLEAQIRVNKSIILSQQEIMRIKEESFMELYNYIKSVTNPESAEK